MERRALLCGRPIRGESEDVNIESRAVFEITIPYIVFMI